MDRLEGPPEYLHGARFRFGRSDVAPEESPTVATANNLLLARCPGEGPQVEVKTFNQEADGTLRQWAEVDFLPGEAGEKKNSQPLRYVGLRLLKPQGVLLGFT
jgi:hypothetical protein